MAELDIERIGQELRMSWSAYLIKHEPAIVTALEDRERLWASEKTVQAELVRLYRIETAAKRAVKGTCPCPWRDLEAALEGRNG